VHIYRPNQTGDFLARYRTVSVSVSCPEVTANDCFSVEGANGGEAARPERCVY